MVNDRVSRLLYFGLAIFSLSLTCGSAGLPDELLGSWHSEELRGPRYENVKHLTLVFWGDMSMDSIAYYHESKLGKLDPRYRVYKRPFTLRGKNIDVFGESYTWKIETDGAGYPVQLSISYTDADGKTYTSEFIKISYYMTGRPDLAPKPRERGK